MADKKITDLVDGSPLQPTDEFVVARAGDNFKIDAADVVAAVTKHDVTLDGNTAGVLALVSSGTMSLAGGNNITLSQAGNAITISGANIGGAQTGISGIVGSDATYTSGTVTISGVGGGVTINSNIGQRIDISVAAPVSQSVQPETQTFIAGISASDTLYTSGNVRISGSQAATVRSGTGQLVIIDVPAQSTQVETQTFIAGVSASDTLYTSGNVRLTGVGGGVTVSSNTGQRVDISVAAQSVQPETQTFIAGVSASDTLYTSGNVRITGVGGGITVSSNTGQRIDLSVAAQSVQPETQTFIAGISASNTLYTSGNVRISGSQAVTVRSGTGQLVIIDVPAQTTQVETQTFIAGVSASDTLYTSGNVRITGVGGGITVSSNTGQRIDLSVAAQTNQAGGVYASSNTFGTSSGTYDARSISIAGRGAASVAASNSGWIISVPVQSTQVETQTFIGGAAASNTTYTSGTFTITGVGGGITVSSNTGQRIDLSVAAPVAQTNQAGSVYAISNTSGTSSGTYDARTLSIAGAGMITVAASNSGWRINATQSVQPETQTFIGGISASDTLYTSGSVRITGVGGGVTVSSNTGQRVDISVAAPVAQTNQAGNVYASSNTFGTSSGTYDARSISIAGRGEISVAASNSGWIISAPAQTVQTQNMVAVTLSGNTSGGQALISSGTLTLAGGNNITVSQAGNAVTISAPNLGAGAMSAGASNLGNTAGATGITGTQLVIVGSDNITLSQTTGANGGTLSIIGGGGGGFSAGVSTGGNTAGATGVTGTRVVFVGSNNITLSQTTGAAGATVSFMGPASSSLSANAPLTITPNGSTLSFLAPATSSLAATGAVEISTNGSTISIGAPNIKTLGDFQNFPLNQAALITHAASISKTPFYFPMEIPGRITNNSFVIRLSAVTTATLQSFTIHGGFYSMVNSTSMALLGSWSETYVQSTASSASWSGVRNYVMTGQGTHTALSVLTGGDYAIGLMFSAGAAGSMAQSIMGAGSANPTLGRIVPGVNAQSTGTSQGAIPLMGRGSTTVNVLPANVVASELVNQGAGASAQLHAWVYIRS